MRHAPATFALVMACAAAVSPACAAAAADDAQIDALVAGLTASGCEFERNGRWHSAASAGEHLQRKLAWLRKRGLAPTAEAFIERAATASSVSGKAYHVRCPGESVVPSSEWFRMRLRQLRTGSATPTPTP